MSVRWSTAVALSCVLGAHAACREPMPKVGMSDEVELSKPAPPKPSASPSASASASAKPGEPEGRGYDRWRVALEVYRPRVAPAAAAPQSPKTSESFTKYIEKVHDAVHPLYTDATVPLDEADPRDALKTQGLQSEVEVTIVGATGEIKRLGVIRRSETVDYDILVLDTLKKAGPFEPAPEEIRSPDGNVYLRWRFSRTPDDGCSTRGTKGYVLRMAPWPP